MNIREFISQYRNHPVLFVGAGLSLRYLNNAYTWDGLLKHIAYELKGNNEFYLDIKAACRENGKYDYTKIATKLEHEFNADLGKDRDGKFKEINDIFYREMEKENYLSRFKIYIAQLVSELDYKEEKREELAELKKVRKNIGSVITTNYDKLIEEVFGFEPLVGNDILLSNPYGSVYKIHGCCVDPSKVIITEDDYAQFNDKYELIRAQLLSIFIHNPIIFMGYGIGDENIKSLLKTIFTYVEFNSEDAEKIRNNFLLVEYEQGSQSHEICEHDIDLEGFSTIRINKLKTDDFNEIYKSLSSLSLPVSAMDIRKVQSIVKDIYSGASDDGTSIKVNITEDIDSLNNSDKILVIGSSKSITYEHKNSASFMTDYFDIIDESNSQLIKLIDSISLAHNQWFPVYAFSDICTELQKAEALKRQQVGKIESHLASLPSSVETNHTDVQAIYDDATVTATRKIDALIWSIWNDKIPADDVKRVLLGMPEKKGTDYRRLLCAYDYKKYS
ncbi:SIR2 family protein [Vibrio parahaemolyticus]|nr:SIR2 family protein [Vibrio parahaemolyticus]